ncbi:MAG: uL15 family ribosomal protein [Clostridia bacterium]|nr:uL15 family ribosomal protein [Clostridia bacterium]
MNTPIFYIPGHIEAVIALAIFAGLVVVANVVLLIIFRKKKEQTETPKPIEKIKTKPADIEPVAKEEVSLKESLAVAVAIGTKGTVTKKSIADYLENTYGNCVEVNRRANATKPGKGKTEGLPLADTHYTLNNGNRTCFVYVYETNGSALLLIKAPSDYADTLKNKHKLVNLSAFPKSKDSWYSVAIDDSWGEKGVYKMLDDVKAINDGGTFSVVEPDTEEDEDIETEVVYDEVKGAFVKIRYNKSFTAKLIQAKDETKNYYSELKNYILSFKFAKKQISDRISWKHESFRLGRDILVKMIIKGKTLCLCLPLNVNDYVDSKYHVEDKSDKKSYFATPTMYRIKNPRRASYAKDLIDAVMAKFGGEKTEIKNVDYVKDYPYEELKPLISRQLIKVLDDSNDVRPTEKDIEVNVLKEVSATQVDKLMTDEQTEKLTEKSQRIADKTRKAMINIDTISAYFNDGETVTIEELKKRVPSFDKKATYYKVCARGVLNKSLTVDADEFSVQAKKMIILTGGKVISL